MVYFMSMGFLQPGGLTHRHAHTDFPDKNNFKKPGAYLVHNNPKLMINNLALT